MQYPSFFPDYLEYMFEEEAHFKFYSDDDHEKEKEEYVTNRKSVLMAKRGRPFAFIEWFFDKKGCLLYLDYMTKKMPTVFPSSWKSDGFDRDKLSWTIYEFDEDERPESAFTVPTCISFEQDIHLLFKEKRTEAILLLKSVDDEEFDKRAFYNQLQFHVNMLTAFELDNMKSVVKDEKFASIFEREYNYFVAAMSHYLRNVSEKYGFIKRSKGTEIKFLIDPGHPLCEKELQFLYSYTFKLKHKIKEQRFISNDTPFDTFKSIINSPDLSDLSIHENERPYIQFGCETRIAVETLVKLQDIIPNICKWKIIEKYEVFRTVSGKVLKSSSASSLPSKIEKKSGSKASKEIAGMLSEIKKIRNNRFSSHLT